MLAEKFFVVDLSLEVYDILDFNLSEPMQLATKKKSKKISEENEIKLVNFYF